jgi:hypothetical protein
MAERTVAQSVGMQTSFLVAGEMVISVERYNRLVEALRGYTGNRELNGYIAVTGRDNPLRKIRKQARAAEAKEAENGEVDI